MLSSYFVFEIDADYFVQKKDLLCHNQQKKSKKIVQNSVGKSSFFHLFIVTIML